MGSMYLFMWQASVGFLKCAVNPWHVIAQRVIGHPSSLLSSNCNSALMGQLFSSPLLLSTVSGNHRPLSASMGSAPLGLWGGSSEIKFISKINLSCLWLPLLNRMSFNSIHIVMSDRISNPSVAGDRSIVHTCHISSAVHQLVNSRWFLFLGCSKWHRRQMPSPCADLIPSVCAQEWDFWILQFNFQCSEEPAYGLRDGCPGVP